MFAGLPIIIFGILITLGFYLGKYGQSSRYVGMESRLNVGFGCFVDIESACPFFLVQQQSLSYGLGEKLSFSTIRYLLQQVTDFDRDGYGPLTIPSDPDGFDANINPYALDFPGNQIDEDGLAGYLKKLVSSAEC